MKYILLLLFLYYNIALFAQKEASTWYFGSNAGIHFSNCNAQAITDGTLNSQEGCSAISDKSSGNILFYTNGVSVWDNTNTLMPNGMGLSGDPSNTQVLIIPKPASSSIFYILTTDVQGISGAGLRYSIVDVSLNSGHGDVVSKNILLHNPTVCEKIAATMHSDGTSIWITCHEYGNNNFLTYLVTSSGITTTPIISSIGHVLSSGYDSRGEMRYSPDGSKLSVANNGNSSGIDSSQIFDFNNSSGIISNCINLPSEKWGYGTCFSIDNSKVYFTTSPVFVSSTTYSKLYQFDLTSGIPLQIINSKIIIDSALVTSEGAFSSCNLAMNGKIYIARDNKDYLGIINYPNNAGVSCAFTKNGLYLAGKQCRAGTNNLLSIVDTCDVTGITNNQLPGTHKIKCFPNPSDDYTIITLDININLPLQLEIYNSTGQLILKKENIKEKTIQIDTSKLSSGFYFFALFSNVDKREIANGSLIRK